MAYNWDALDELPSKLETPSTDFNRLRPYFENIDTVNTTLDLHDNALTNEEKQKMVLSESYAESLGMSSEEVSNNFDAVSASYFGAELPISEQYRTLQHVYQNARQKEIQPIGARKPSMSTNQDESEVESKLATSLASGKPFRDLEAYDPSYNMFSEFGNAFGRGSANVARTVSGAARLLAGTSDKKTPLVFGAGYVPMNEQGIINTDKKAAFNKIANDVDTYLDEATEYYEGNPELTQKLKTLGDSKYFHPGWITRLAGEQVPVTGLMAATGAGVGGKVSAGLTTLLKANAPWYKSLAVKGAGALIGAGVNRTAESLMEAGGAGAEIKNMGGTDEQAYTAVEHVYKKNMGAGFVMDFTQYMLLMTPGKFGTILGMMIDAPLEGVEELYQESITKTGLAKAMPELAEKIMPDKTFIEMFDIRDPQKREVFISGMFMSLGQTAVPALMIKTTQEVAAGKKPPWMYTKVEKLFQNDVKNKKQELTEKEGLTENEENTLDIINKHEDKNGNIRDLNGLSTELFDSNTEHFQQVASDILGTDTVLNEMTVPELETLLEMPESGRNRAELINIAEQKARLQANDATVNEFIEYQKTTNAGKLIFESFEAETLQEKVDSGEMTTEEALKIRDEHGMNIPINEVYITGANTPVARNDIVKGVIRYAKSVKDKPGADVGTLVEESVELHFKDKYGVDANGDFMDTEFNDFINQERLDVANRTGFSNTKNNIEYVSNIAVNRFLNKVPDKTYLSFSDKFRRMVDALVDILKQIYDAGGKLAKAFQEGAFSEDLLNILDEAIEGKLTDETMRQNIESDPAFKQAVKEKDDLTYQAAAFHGSPHSIQGGFSTDKIGTGEGYQAFGWGLYFSTQEGVARHYAENLTDTEYFFNGKKTAEYFADRPSEEEWIINAHSYLKRTNKKEPTNGQIHAYLLTNISEKTDQNKAIEEEKKNSKDKDDIIAFDSVIKNNNEVIEGSKKGIEILKNNQFKTKKNRNLYDVTLWKDHKENLLDWYKPPTKTQRKTITDAIKRENIKISIFRYNLQELMDTETWDQRHLNTPVLDIYRELIDSLGSKKEVSLFLKRAGFDGIRYPVDSFSGNTKEGKYNYVVFDENAVKIDKHTTYQLSSTDKLVDQYIDTYEKASELEDTFNSYGSTEHAEESRLLVTDALNVLEELTGLKAPQPKKKGGLAPILNKANRDVYIREVKQFTQDAKDNKESYAYDLDNIAPGQLSEKDLRGVIKSLKKSVKRLISSTYEGQINDYGQNVPKKETKAKNKVENKALTDNLVQQVLNLQRHMEEYAQVLPKEIRYMANTEIRNIAKQLGKDPATIERNIDKALIRFDEILDINEKYNLTSEIAKILRNKRIRKDTTGRIINRTMTVEEQRFINDIKKVAWLGEETIAQQMSEIDRKLTDGLSEQDIVAGITQDSLLDDLYRLSTFGNLMGKDLAGTRLAFNILSDVIERGIAARISLDEQYKQTRNKNIEKGVEAITGNKGILTGKEAEDIQDKQNTYLWKFLRSPENFRFNHLSFEYTMNALSRRDVKSGHLKGELQKYSRQVHDATHQRENAVFNRGEKLTNKMLSIFGVKRPGKLMRTLKKYNTANLKPSKKGDIIAEPKSPVKVKDIEYKKNNITIDQAIDLITEWDKTGEYLYNGKELAPRTVDLVYQKVASAEYFGNKGQEDMLAPFEIEYINSKSGYRGVDMSQFEAIQYALMAEQEDAIQNMFYHGWDDNSLSELYNFLTPESKKIKKYLQDEYRKQYEPMNEVYKKLFHTDMPQIINYARAMYEYNKGDQNTDLENILGGGALGASATPVTVIARVRHNRKPKKVSALDVFSQSINETEHFKAFGEIAKMLRGVFKSEQVRNAITQEYGKEKLKAVSQSMDDLINGGIDNVKIVKGIDAIRSWSTRLILSGKLSNLLKQSSSHPAYMMNMPIKDYIKYTAEFFRNPIDNWNTIYKSDFIKTRFKRGYNKELRLASAEAKGKPKGYLRDLLDHGMYFTKLGDIMPIVPGFYASYKSYYNRNKTSDMNKVELAQLEKDAIRQAEMVTERTQQAGSEKDLGHYQRMGSFAKLFQMFITSQRQYMSAVTEAAADAIAGKPRATKQAAKNMAVVMTLGIMFQAMSDAYKYALSGGEDLPEWEDYAVSAFFSPWAGFMMAGTTINYAARKLFGLRASGLSTTAIDNVIQSTVDAGTHMTEGEFKKALNDILRNLGAYQSVKPLIKKKK